MRLLPTSGCRRVFLTAIALVFAVLTVGCSAPPATSAQPAVGPPVPACPRPANPGQPLTTMPPTTATTVATLGQAYFCVLDNWADGVTLDDRVLVTGAFAGLTQELQRRGLASRADWQPQWRLGLCQRSSTRRGSPAACWAVDALVRPRDGGRRRYCAARHERISELLDWNICASRGGGTRDHCVYLSIIARQVQLWSVP